MFCNIWFRTWNQWIGASWGTLNNRSRSFYFILTDLGWSGSRLDPQSSSGQEPFCCASGLQSGPIFSDLFQSLWYLQSQFGSESVHAMWDAHVRGVSRRSPGSARKRLYGPKKHRSLRNVLGMVSVPLAKYTQYLWRKQIFSPSC